MFDGFLSFGGIEIINAARTTAYIKNMLPAFPLLRRTDQYDTLQDALEHAPYRTPFLDQADWVETDTGNTWEWGAGPFAKNDTHQFFGLYPLAIEGIGDSTMGANVTEGILDGGSIGSERDTTRTIRVRGLLVGANDIAVETGLSWLRNALRRNSCAMHGDQCGYSDLRYFLAKPCVDDEAYPTKPNSGESIPMGVVNAASSPVIAPFWPAAQESQPHLAVWYRGDFDDFDGPWDTTGLDGVIIEWGALEYRGPEVLESHGPLFVRRSNFVPNPRFATSASSWNATSGFIARSDVGGTHGEAYETVPVEYRMNYLPDPSFENGSPESFGWRANTTIQRQTDGTPPNGTYYAEVERTVPEGGGDPAAWIEATMLGPFEDDFYGSLIFSKACKSSLTIHTVDSNGEDMFFSTIPETASDDWESWAVTNMPIKSGYIMRITLGGEYPEESLKVDRLLLSEDPNAVGDFFDGDTADDPGSDTYYDFVTGSPSGPSRERIGEFDTIQVQTVQTQSSSGDVVAAFLLRARHASPSVTVELIDSDDVVLATTVVSPGPDWSRFALGTPYGRAIRLRLTSEDGAFDINEVSIEAGAQLNDYFDGGYPAPSDYAVSWAGAPHNSVSVMTWLGNTEIDRQTNWRAFFNVVQGSIPDLWVSQSWTYPMPMQYQLDKYDRTYHRVYCTTGVKRIRDYKLDVGAATEVDFIFTAGNPHAFSTQTTFIGTGGDYSEQIIDDYVTNWATNPSPQEDATGWSQFTDTGAISGARVAGVGVGGAYGYQATVTTTIPTTAAMSVGLGSGSADIITVTPGLKVVPSLYINPAVTNRFWITVAFFTSAAVQVGLSIVQSAAVVTGGVFTRLVGQELVVPDTATRMRIRAGLATGTGAVDLVGTQTNLITNPNLETNATGYSARAGASVARTTTPAEIITGTASMLVTLSATGGSMHMVASGARPAVVAGSSYAGSVDVKALDTGSANVRMVIDWYTSGSVFISSSNGTTIDAPQNQVVRPSVIATAPPTAAFGNPYVEMGNSASGKRFSVDNQRFGISNINDPHNLLYFDGSSVESGRTFAWTGTINASTSTRSGDTVVVDRISTAAGEYFDGSFPDDADFSYEWANGDAYDSASFKMLLSTDPGTVIDPDLPVIPTPPSPPTIPDLATEVITQWTRYYMTIPKSTVALWARTIPTITLLTNGEDVRQVRVRFFPNPFEWDRETVDPTSFCGEFIISYLPPNSALTVSGVSREAYVSVGGKAPVSANHLLYGTGGTPMVWPELSCDLDYVMTIDIPPTVNFDNLDINLVLNLQE